MLEEGKEYIAVEISEESTRIFSNTNEARQYIDDYKADDYEGYYDYYNEYPVISMYKIKVTKKLL